MAIRSLWGVSSAKALRIGIAALLGVSAVSTLLGIDALYTFDQTSGPVAASPGIWPALSSLKLMTRADTLLVFVHPYCPCSVATVTELASLADRAHFPSTEVLFFRPENSGWQPGSLWTQVQREIPSARIVWDEGGREASRFDAGTSGYTLLYKADGALLFRGGVTGSRGHEGDNLGIDRLRAALETGRAETRASLVFGCALLPVKSGRTSRHL